ncbi:MAG: cyclic pyranopterin monophosphate synthase MoaC [Planctomycetes bacterium]|nr:cyclic pyranopterin monophosphate synthase MoaC [Planctomycetota bacterium]
MVDVGAKAVTERTAEARALVRFPNADAARLVQHGGPKGPITEIARAAALLAAKRTSALIPMCHPLALDAIDVTFTPRGKRVLEVRCTARCTGKTGVEMEAMLGAAIAALTVYDMTKALDHGITITDLQLLEKRGGKSGLWRAAKRKKA